MKAYYKHNGNLREITNHVGLPVWICAKTLENLGLSPNWASYKERAETGKLGDWAEEEFKRLVPSALDMNMQYQMNNPRFDFVVNGKEIDVKFSTQRKTRGNHYQYALRYYPENMPDFFCLFCSDDKAEDKRETPSGYRILLIPKEAMPKNREMLVIIADRHNLKAVSAMFWDFEVQPAALEMILEHS